MSTSREINTPPVSAILGSPKNAMARESGPSPKGGPESTTHGPEAPHT
jgi:hypothetical protein